MNRRGSVLVTTVWAITFLTAIALGAAAAAEGQVAAVRRLLDRVTSTQAARRAVEEGIGWLRQRADEEGDEGEAEETPPTGVAVFGENTRVSLNGASAAVLAQLITAAGVPDGFTAEEIAAAIVDWRDADNDASPNGGVEAPYYEALADAYPCADAPFQSVEELLLVRGVTSELWAKLRDHVTTSPAAAINLNGATSEALQAAGMSAGLAQLVVAYGLGGDETAGTDDDRVFSSAVAFPGELSQVSSLTSDQQAEAATLAAGGGLTTDETVWRVRAVQGRRVVEGTIETRSWDMLGWREYDRSIGDKA